MRPHKLSLDDVPDGRIDEVIVELLSKDLPKDIDVQEVCLAIGETLNFVLYEYGKRIHKRKAGQGWSTDGLVVEQSEIKNNVLSAEGTCWWIDQSTSWFKLDVQIISRPILYSCKFMAEAAGSQFLYVARHADHWQVSE